ncbi:MAG: hypothetical protein ACXV8O_03545 [Methylobacter sp.]
MLEVAGTVQALGDNISHLKTGEKVCVLVTGGVMLSACFKSDKNSQNASATRQT